ncbi:hypothetical protein BO85DRAFT_454484 [Aspergillus piperis CBS 112811]|uniref:Uncharacterized protein n=1 Tax=Aspergillus piperis CBS 112811 TaxID=1448313 RepID=A0A8G1QPG8_9EURO|nr:hypothetical protein BO85DRAFT_454484 [Aspergillus piperis CBS 112811]RAH51821.1 hypothetical protein BO85DRAFT_454484 [Aspergillus piperis CBS 112811]
MLGKHRGLEQGYTNPCRMHHPNLFFFPTKDIILHKKWVGRQPASHDELIYLFSSFLHRLSVEGGGKKEEVGM